MGPESNYDNAPTMTALEAGAASQRVSQRINDATCISADFINTAASVGSSFADSVGYLQEQIDFLMKVMQESLPNAKNFRAWHGSQTTETHSTYSDTDDFEVDSDELDSFLSDFARTEG